MQKPKQEKNIGVRELTRTARQILRATQQGATFVVRIHGKPVARLTPIAKPSPAAGIHKLLQLRAKSRERDWSKRIDDLAYGA